MDDLCCNISKLHSVLLSGQRWVSLYAPPTSTIPAFGKHAHKAHEEIKSKRKQLSKLWSSLASIDVAVLEWMMNKYAVKIQNKGCFPLQILSMITLCCGSWTRFASASRRSAFRFGSTNTPRRTPSSSRQRSKSKTPTPALTVCVHIVWMCWILKVIMFANHHRWFIKVMKDY